MNRANSVVMKESNLQETNTSSVKEINTQESPNLQGSNDYNSSQADVIEENKNDKIEKSITNIEQLTYEILSEVDQNLYCIFMVLPNHRELFETDDHECEKNSKFQYDCAACGREKRVLAYCKRCEIALCYKTEGYDGDCIEVFH